MSQSSYSDAGVDVQKGEQAVERIKKHVEGTFNEHVLRGVGAFAGAFDAVQLKNVAEPVLLSTVDGVGTKTVVAEMTGDWSGVGHDIVNHCANDLVCQGGRPLIFMDYAASSSLDPSILETIVKGMCDACKDHNCVLIGGETAEMPQVYCEGAHDIVGAMVGFADKAKMFATETITAGDVLIALPSNGLHTNGYSLARKALFEAGDFAADEHKEELGCTVGEALLAPHTPYANLVLSLHESIGLKGVAHITGGGIYGNLKRILPDGVAMQIDRSKINVLPIFELIQSAGNVPEDDMYEAFNMGVGMILVVDASKKSMVLEQVNDAYEIGSING